MTLCVFLLALGATARLTRLITDDRITSSIRTRALTRFGPDHTLTYWLYCPWCVSPWLGGAVFTAAWFYGDTPGFVIPTAALSASWLIGTAAAWLDAPAGDAR